MSIFAVHTGSPLGELNRCVQEKIRVKVHIRTFKGLRGVCSGFVVAFDKFWNLVSIKVPLLIIVIITNKCLSHFFLILWCQAMVDVDETYREPLLGQALYHEKALTVTRVIHLNVLIYT